MSADAQVRHGAFYAACQALLYVLCYHMEPLLRPKHKHQQGHAANGPAPASLPNGSGLAAGVGQRQQAAAAAAAGMPGSLGASGGTPASLDGLPSSLRSQERREAVHAQVRNDAGVLRLGRWSGQGGMVNSLCLFRCWPRFGRLLRRDRQPFAPTCDPCHLCHAPALALQREACADAVRALFSGPMPHLLRHALDPLSSCARSVVAEFGRQVRCCCFFCFY